MLDEYGGAAPRAAYQVGGERSVIDFPVGADPFAILAQVEARLFPDKKLSDNAPRKAQTVSKAPADANPQPRPSQAKEAALPRPAGVRDTSMRAYRSLERSGKLSRQQCDVLEAMAASGRADMTRQELSEASGIPINAVCGRVHELLEGPFPFLEELPARRCGATGNTANPVRRRP